MSSLGWGILTNCTYSHTYNLGATDKNKIWIDSDDGVIDFYVFLADSMIETMQRYLNVAGKPLLMPKFAYGATFVCNEADGARQLLEDCVSFRNHKIPCDMMALEPNWMEVDYDLTTNKNWNKDKFFTLPTAKLNNKDKTDVTTFF